MRPHARPRTAPRYPAAYAMLVPGAGWGPGPAPAAAPASLGDRTGFGGTVAFEPRYFRPLIASVSGSTGGYNRARIGLEHGPALVEYQTDWRPHDLFFGIGPAARVADKSSIASQT